jgi:hypothetical protein
MSDLNKTVREKLYFPLSKLDQFEKEIKTVPVDGDGHVIPVNYSEEFVRGTILKLIADHRLLYDHAEAQEREIEHWKRLYESYMNNFIATVGERNIMREALEWYADEQKYREHDLDWGKRARQALGNDDK